MSTAGAQFREDEYLAEIFPSDRGVCLEVGAFDGLAGSATYRFEQRGWLAVLVEPVPFLAEKARAARRGPVFAVAAGPANGVIRLQQVREDPAISTVSSATSAREMQQLRGVTVEEVEVPQRTVDSILEESGVTRLDFATIDVEGYEAEVLGGFSLARWQPRVVILEDNSGGTDRRVPDLMARSGYRRFWHTGVNDWYARAEDRALVTAGALFRERMRLAGARGRVWTKRFTPRGLKRVARAVGLLK